MLELSWNLPCQIWTRTRERRCIGVWTYCLTNQLTKPSRSSQPCRIVRVASCPCPTLASLSCSRSSLKWYLWRSCAHRWWSGFNNQWLWLWLCYWVVNFTLMLGFLLLFLYDWRPGRSRYSRISISAKLFSQLSTI